MTYVIYIAAAIVIGLLIAFVALSILWLRDAVLRSIRSRTLGLISVYDDLLETKSRELKAVEEEITQAATAIDSADSGQMSPERINPAGGIYGRTAQPDMADIAPAQLLGAVERSFSAVYREKSLGGIYMKIREGFTFDLEEIVQVVSHAADEDAADDTRSAGMGSIPAGDEAETTGSEAVWQDSEVVRLDSEVVRLDSDTAGMGAAARLLRELDHDTAFRLSTMLSEDQESILREAMSADQVSILDEYMREKPAFAILDFYDYLRFSASARPEGYSLRVPRSMAADRSVRGSVMIIPDSGICEGFQLETGHILYDYCIKARELS